MSALEDIHARAVKHHQAGELDRAELFYRQVLAADPGHARAWHLLGVLIHQQGDSTSAVEHIERALALDGTNGVFFGNLGSVYRSLGRLGEAEAALRRALALVPNFVASYYNLGLVLSEQDRAEEAIPCLEQALRLQPDQADVLRVLGWALAEAGAVKEAVAVYRRAGEIRPDPIYRVLAATQLPLVYRSLADVHAWRGRVIKEVARLLDEGATVSLDREIATPVFCLAYHGENDREMQRSLCRLYQAPPDPPLVPRSRADGRIHVGFLSSFFCRHTIGKLMRGLIAHLPRPEFYVTVFSIGRRQDEIAGFIRQNADEYVEVPRDLPRARRTIAEAGADVLFYAEIGMDQTTYSLAFSRLAPVQCVTWGHPVTTGLSTIDYFLSSALLEPAGAEEHYTERLVRLRTLPFYYYRPELPAVLKGRDAFELDDNAHLYVCPQSIYKFHPDFDALLAEILRRDPLGQVVLIRWPYRRGNELLRERFTADMPDVVERVRFIRRLKEPEFLNLLTCADVVLDPLHFGGGNSSCEALALGVPIVTLPGAFLRGRVTLGLYRKMNVLDCVAASAAHYVELAVRLGTDRDYRRQIQDKILAANHVLYEDAAAVRELAAFFREAVACCREKTNW